MRETYSDQGWFIFNGIVSQALPNDFAMNNRGFRLGDGFFETMRYTGGKVHLWNAHLARAMACAKIMKLQIPPEINSGKILNLIDDVMQKNRLAYDGRVRITFFREGKGTYFPGSNEAGYIAEIETLNHFGFRVSEQGIRVGIYPDMKKAKGPLAAFKIMGNHVYIGAAIWAQSENFDDVLILNEQHEIIEAVSSNIFIVKAGAIYTPPVSSGCVGGVMRMAVINAALKSGVDVYEAALKADDIVTAEEVFLTNAVSGIKWVSSFQTKRYFHKLSDRLIGMLNQKIPAFS